MSAKKLSIKKAVRYPATEQHDTLILEKGVNVIVGDMNAGKTKWLQMIDFVLGDQGSSEDAFDQQLSEKYERLTLTLDVDGEEFTVERRWKETGSRTKIFVNEDGMTAKQFSEFILSKLNIPLIHVPSGNPFADRTWPELSWRELLRHIYKQERFWSDFAQKQSEVVRSACLLHFLDAAKNLYSAEYGELIARRKEKERLEAEKNVFLQVMQDLAVNFISQPDVSIAVTPDSIAAAKQRLNSRLTEIGSERSILLESRDRQNSLVDNGFAKAKQKLEQHHTELGEIEKDQSRIIRRKMELREYAKTLEVELSRFARVKAGAFALADLKVTHCPACDQEVRDGRYGPDRCQVCGQVHSMKIGERSSGQSRIEFEEQQINEELIELRRLIEELEEEQLATEARVADLTNQIHAESQRIIAARDLAVRALPPELSLLEREAGQIVAELQQLERILQSLRTREEINARAVQLEEGINVLEAEIKQMTPNVNYGQLGDLLSDRMNDYLNALNTDSLSRWKTGRISVRLRRDSFELFLDGQPWTIRAGGTANYIVQIAYHYALFSLTKDNRYNYPGFLVVYFPPHFAKANDLRDSENYLLKPFVTLCRKEEMKGAQVIIAGRAFDNLVGASVVRL